MTITVVVLLSIILILLTIILFIQIKSISSDYGKEVSSTISPEIQKIISEVRDEFSRNREEFSKQFQSQRSELDGSFKLFSDQLFNRMAEVSNNQKDQLKEFSDTLKKLIDSNEIKFDKLNEKVVNNLKEIQTNNEKKLEEMRATVDEKLQSTLEKRLGESFKIVSERLEVVHKGLGEMQNLATGVGDLKRVLTNVKTRGTWGEVQLEALIEQVLTQDQYEKNVITRKGSNDRVEIAIKMPGRNNNIEDVVLIPIDAKFPLEDYQRLVEAQESANPEMLEQAAKALESRIKLEAKNIASKYLDPPNTTDFAFMFLPIEGLYAEVLRRPGLFDFLQREHRVTIAGPTNFLAVLNSLQIGFRTLAIEKRSSEVWKLLGVVKTEFGKFGDLLEKTQTKLDQASRSIGDATKKTRTIERKLRNVQELPTSNKLSLPDRGEEID